VKQKDMMRRFGENAKAHMMKNYMMEKSIGKVYSLLREASLTGLGKMNEND